MTDAQLIEQMLHECRRLTLLYVEDDLILAENTVQMLMPFFKSIVVQHDGQAGLAAYQSQHFDIVLTDIMMPKMDGCAMARAIRELDAEQAIVVMSAHEETQHFLELIEVGISKFVPKPPKLQQIFSSMISTAINVNNAKQVAQLAEFMKQDLAESKELLRNIIDTVPVRIFWKDRSSRYLGCNQLFAQDAGYPNQNDIIDKYDQDLVWHEQAQGFVADDMAVMDSEIDKLHFEEEQTRSDGSVAWVSTSKRPLRDVNGHVMGVLGCYIDITEQKKALLAMQEAQRSLHYQAHHDALTGLVNRMTYLEQLNVAMIQAKACQRSLAVVFIDIDRFKEINDTLGHETGDEVVVLVANRLQRTLPNHVHVARFGGDEFMLFVEDVESRESLSNMMQQLLRLTEQPFLVNGHSLHITLSAGVSLYPDDGDCAEILIRNADTAMYQAKTDGRDTYQFYTRDMTNRRVVNLHIANSLRIAIEKKELTVYYQPQVDAQHNRLVGMEALVRWYHPIEGFIPPSVFIPVAEEAGLIEKVGQLVLEEAVSQLVSWYAEGYHPGTLAINLSTIELQKPNFVDCLEAKLTALHCQPEWIELEITEGYTMRHPEDAIKMLHKMQALGIRLSIDDFGTGYSSLSYLKRLPIHKLKIDQSFVRDIPGNSNDEAIVHAIISLANTMHFDVIAEGVETPEQRAFLLDHGCANMQGYLFAQPVPAEQMTALLIEYQAREVPV